MRFHVAAVALVAAAFAVGAGRPLNATVTLPSLTGQPAPPPAVVVPPTDGGGGFPWLLVGLGVVVVGGIALAARSR